MRILVMEASTTSAKIMIYHTEKGIESIASKAYGESISKEGRHNVEGITQILFSMVKQLPNTFDIDAIALVGTWHNFLLCNNNFVPEDGSYTWESTYGSENARVLRKNKEFVKNQHRKTGCMVNSIYPAYKLLAMANNGVDFSNKMIMDEMSYIFYGLTGDISCSESCASGMGMLQVSTLQWDEHMLEQIGINKKQLPKIVKYDYTYPLKESIAKELNLKAGTAVFIGEPDGAMNQLGAGALGEGIMTIQ